MSAVDWVCGRERVVLLHLPPHLAAAVREPELKQQELREQPH